MTTVITFGTFDVFHVGHLRVIERAAALGDRLVVGVSADALNLSKKGREPVFSQAERLAIVAALKPVDEVFVEESLELKRHYIEQYAADVLVMGDDWAGRFDEFEDVCEVVYLPRTPAISTTALIEKISATSRGRATRSPTVLIGPVPLSAGFGLARSRPARSRVARSRVARSADARTTRRGPEPCPRVDSENRLGTPHASLHHPSRTDPPYPRPRRAGAGRGAG